MLIFDDLCLIVLIPGESVLAVGGPGEPKIACPRQYGAAFGRSGRPLCLGREADLCRGQRRRQQQFQPGPWEGF